jgi:AcrR family transcriptional regulator
MTEPGAVRRRRSRQPVEVRREQVLDAALSLLAHRGFGALNMEAIAREVRLSKPVVYAAYPDLEALVAALIDREERRLLSRMAEVTGAATARPTVRESLLVWLAGMADVVQSDPHPWVVMLVRPDDSPEYLRDHVGAGREALREQLGQVMRVHEQTLERFGTSDAEMVTHAVLAMAEHFVRLMLSEPERYHPVRLLDFAAALVDRIVPS